jgi:isorenieratene synthase
VITDRVRALDSVTTYHRFDAECRAWAEQNGGGSVLELHCYAVPDELGTDAEVRVALLEELRVFYPELAGGQVMREHLQVRDDFPAFHRGMARFRPKVETAVAGLHLAGDWVRLPFPAMLMEAAFSSGLLAANRVLDGLGVQAEPVYHVPLTGLLHGVPGGDLPDA